MTDLNVRIALIEERTAALDARLKAFERRLWMLGLLVAAGANALDLVAMLS